MGTLKYRLDLLKHCLNEYPQHILEEIIGQGLSLDRTARLNLPLSIRC